MNICIVKFPLTQPMGYRSKVYGLQVSMLVCSHKATPETDQWYAAIWVAGGLPARTTHIDLHLHHVEIT